MTFIKHKETKFRTEYRSTDDEDMACIKQGLENDPSIELMLSSGKEKAYYNRLFEAGMKTSHSDQYCKLEIYCVSERKEKLIKDLTNTFGFEFKDKNDKRNK